MGKTLLLLLVMTLHAEATSADGRLSLESGPGRAGALAWQSAVLAFSPRNAPDDDPSWQLDIEGLALTRPLGSLHVDCMRGGFGQGRPWCADGRFEWHWADSGERLAGRLGAPRGGSGIAIELQDLGLSGRLSWSADAGQQPPSGDLQLTGFELGALPVRRLEALGLSVLEGQVNGRIEFSAGQLSFDLELDEGAFDRPDGLIAGAGLSLALRGSIDGIAEGEDVGFSLGLVQRAGELLAGPVYLPPPDAPLALDLAGVFRQGTSLSVDSLTLDDGGLVEASGDLVLEVGEDGWQLAELALERVRLDFPGAWQRWGEGPASSRGFGGLATEGELAASLAWRSGRLQSLELRLEDVGVRDAAGRFALDSLGGRLERSPDRLQAELGWAGLDVFSLAFGGSNLSASGTPGDWQLTRPLSLPLLDGAVVIDQLEVDADESGGPSLVLDARIEPLELSELTRMLGFPVFGGRLSGGFPGVRVSGDRITFAGGIDVQAFSGGIRLSDLVIERPFGSLPALAAQVEIERLDLAELTGAFNFGHMEGELSGWMRDLRLLDWRPVAMDARLFTHDDAPRRRISQRAVENLSRLGGGAAAIGATVLRIFDEFPYRRAGLACRLDRNICHIDGVGPHESGGFYIVEGRGLPHLDVVGHRRLIDWPRLVAQLMAATEG